jgi:hypothetical protein
MEIMLVGNAALTLLARVFELLGKIQSGEVDPDTIRPEELRLPDPEEIIARARAGRIPG